MDMLASDAAADIWQNNLHRNIIIFIKTIDEVYAQSQSRSIRKSPSVLIYRFFIVSIKLMMLLSVKQFTHLSRLSPHKIRQIPEARRGRMRVHHAIAIVAVVLIGFGLKLTFFSAPPAEAVPVEGMRMDIFQMHQNIRN